MATQAREADGSYEGPDRRRHRVYVTRNTEYHFRDGVCVGVRDKRSGEWLPGHIALRRKLFGSIRFFDSDGMMPTQGTPRMGESLFFDSGGRDIVTSALVGSERPPRELVESYTM